MEGSSIVIAPPKSCLLSDDSEAMMVVESQREFPKTRRVTARDRFSIRVGFPALAQRCGRLRRRRRPVHELNNADHGSSSSWHAAPQHRPIFKRSLRSSCSNVDGEEADAEWVQTIPRWPATTSPWRPSTESLSEPEPKCASKCVEDESGIWKDTNEKVSVVDPFI